MTHDREEDILYLAHQLWEEQAASFPSARSCWQDAACEILSNRRARYTRQDDACAGSTEVRQVQPALQFGSSPVITPGKAVSASRIALVKPSPHVKIANPAIFLVYRADRA